MTYLSLQTLVMYHFPSCLACLFFLIAVTGCNKEQTSPPKQGFSVQLLTAHSWKLKRLLYRQKDETTNEDFTAFEYQDCELDDIYTFGADSTFSRADAGVSCDPPFYFGPNGSGTWSFDSSLTAIAIITFTYHASFTVDALNDTSLVIEQPTIDAFRNEIVYTYEFEPE